MSQSTTDSDFEFYLRGLLRDLPDNQPAQLHFWVNNESRIQFSVRIEGAPEREFISFGNQLLPVLPKPPTQIAAVQGFDAHKGMGER